jgi:hypothetical protein
MEPTLAPNARCSKRLAVVDRSLDTMKEHLRYAVARQGILEERIDQLTAEILRLEGVRLTLMAAPLETAQAVA